MPERGIPSPALPPGKPGLSASGWAVFLFDYAGAIQEALHRAKFQKREDLLPRLAKEWQEGLAREGRFAWQLPAEVQLAVTAIPTDPVRLRQRGYDVPEAVFRPWAQQAGYPWATLLRRVKATRPQFSLSPTERRKNLKGCFALAPGAALPDIVLLCEQRCLRLIQISKCMHSRKNRI